MRELMLKRIELIRKTIGRDLFGSPETPWDAKWPSDFDFSTLDDEALLNAFVSLVAKSYRQR